MVTKFSIEALKIFWQRHADLRFHSSVSRWHVLPCFPWSVWSAMVSFQLFWHVLLIGNAYNLQSYSCPVFAWYFPPFLPSYLLRELFGHVCKYCLSHCIIPFMLFPCISTSSSFILMECIRGQWCMTSYQRKQMLLICVLSWSIAFWIDRIAYPDCIFLNSSHLIVPYMCEIPSTKSYHGHLSIVDCICHSHKEGMVSCSVEWYFRDLIKLLELLHRSVNVAAHVKYQGSAHIM